MQFKDVTGQQEVKRRLIRTVKDNRISHAQLFTGSQGSGSLSLALAYAAYIQCTGEKDDDSCGKCPSCLKNSKYIHPDLHFVFPVAGSQKGEGMISDDLISEWREMLKENTYISLNQWLDKIGSENKQGVINVRESRSILKKLSFKSYESEYKIMIIWMPEKMNQASANKLLKIIEEPPLNTLFLLVSEDPGQVMKTIVSRTQLIKIQKIEDEDMTAYLQRITELSDEEIKDIVRLAGGSCVNALSLVSDNESYQSNLDNFMKMMRLSFAGDYGEMIRWTDQIASAGREKQKNLLQFSLGMIRNNFMINRDIPELAYMNRVELDFSSKFCRFIHPGNVGQITAELNKAYYHIERNAYSKIVFLDLSLILNRLLRI